MHGQRSAAARVDETGEASTRPPRRLRRHPSSREEGKADHPARCAAPLLKRGGESRPPRRLRRHPSSREEGKSDHPAAYGGTPPQERRGKPTTPPPTAAPLLKRGGEIRRGRAPLSAWR